jgi:hypothetical protein
MCVAFSRRRRQGRLLIRESPVFDGGVRARSGRYLEFWVPCDLIVRDSSNSIQIEIYYMHIYILSVEAKEDVDGKIE